MTKELRILIIEDNSNDVELMEYELRKAGIGFSSKMVNTKDAFLKELNGSDWDAIISGYSLPQLNGLEAFRLFKELKIHAPYILVTDSLNEETAVKCIREGMDDYILKESLKRLPSALNHALEKKKAKNEAKKAILSLKESEERFRIITETANDAIIYIEEEGKVYHWNRKAEELFGYSADDALGKDMHQLIVPEKHHQKAYEGLKRFHKTGAGPLVGKTVEVTALRRDGTEFPVEVSISSVKIGAKWHATGIIRDITERKAAEEKLRQSMDELKRFNKLMVGREISMGELREENERLKKEIQDLKLKTGD